MQRGLFAASASRNLRWSSHPTGTPAGSSSDVRSEDDDALVGKCWSYSLWKQCYLQLLSSIAQELTHDYRTGP